VVSLVTRTLGAWACMYVSNGLVRQEKQVERISRQMSRLVPWLEEADRATCKAWAEVEVLTDLVYLELNRSGFLQLGISHSRYRREQRAISAACVAFPRGGFRILGRYWPFRSGKAVKSCRSNDRNRGS
jgi:hypothetical protein